MNPTQETVIIINMFPLTIESAIDFVVGKLWWTDASTCSINDWPIGVNIVWGDSEGLN